MHSALIHTTRSYAACHMTTAHQRRPNPVPLVLEIRSTHSTTHLVDIIQTVSRFNSLIIYFQCLDYTFILFHLLTSFDIDMLAHFIRSQLLIVKYNRGFIINNLISNREEQFKGDQRVSPAFLLAELQSIKL
jgi:hypothetical protein